MSSPTEARLIDGIYKPSKHGHYHCICAAADMRSLCKAKYHIQNPHSEHWIPNRAARRKAEALMLKGKLHYQPRPKPPVDNSPTAGDHVSISSTSDETARASCRRIRV